MGLVQSDQTRTVTFENDLDPGITILVSEDVRKRIFDNLDKKEKSETVPKPGPNNSPPQTTSKNPNQVLDTSDMFQDQNNSHYGRSQKLVEENDQYWRNTLQNMENVLRKSNTIMENEFQTTYAQVQETFAKSPSSFPDQPCQEFKNELLQCYGNNPGKTLECFAEVTAFANCVNRSRVKRLDRKDGIYELGDEIKF